MPIYNTSTTGAPPPTPPVARFPAGSLYFGLTCAFLGMHWVYGVRWLTCAVAFGIIELAVIGFLLSLIEDKLEQRGRP